MEDQNPEKYFINQPPKQYFPQQNSSLPEQSPYPILPQENQNCNKLPYPSDNNKSQNQKKSSKFNLFQKRKNMKKASSPIFNQQSKNNNKIQKKSVQSLPNKYSNCKNLKKASSPIFIQRNANMKITKEPSGTNISRNNENIIQVPNSKPTHKLLKTQTFQVLYDGSTFIVDPISLSSFSLRFNDLIQPYIGDYEEMKAMHLEIRGNQFTKRNMNNFLRLCQKLPTDVDNSEMIEICEIAKMFKAEEIYKTGLDFVQAYLDPNFSVPEDKYDNTCLSLIEKTDFLQNSALNSNDNICSVEIDSTNQNSDHNNQQKIEIINENSDEPCQKEENSIQTNDNNNDKSSSKSVIYMVRVQNHTFKCPIFKFVKDEHIIYTAKQKFNDIFIGEGCEIHIRNKENHVAHIYQHEVDQFNKIHIGDIKFPLKYVNSGIPGRFSIEVTFPFNDKDCTMTPKAPNFDLKTERYYLDCNGDYQHTPIISSRNIVLQNNDDLSHFIVRKMDLNLYEIECNENLDPLIVFTIALSDIVGPFNNPYANITLYD